MEYTSLLVNEIFYSLQGEGSQMGAAAIFIRLAHCNLSCSFCDTDFDSYELIDIDDIRKKIAIYPTCLIIWTGGEPLLQLNENILLFFKTYGYKQAIETNGTCPILRHLDYISCSPKSINIHQLHQNFPNGVDEFRFPVTSHTLKDLPIVSDLPIAKHYFLSPIFDSKNQLSREDIDAIVEYIKKNPEWKLSLQMHKLIAIP